MLELRTTSKFRKDYKRIKKRGYDLALLEAVLEKLLNQEPLETKYKDHALTGSYAGFRECHIQPDWLLSMRSKKTSSFLLLPARVRTQIYSTRKPKSHSETGGFLLCLRSPTWAVILEWHSWHKA
ncbi:type II toxin-antitoxin system YafQ family toxin [Corynebacterium poyangense]|uniref:type II toxin-antitoxin system YafQ family toxin n=1 Tax=Corynebacterium poyangense TaxID=2684405 RepID=UPI001CC98463|nr:type II toxin-antitoxin system YafQ family toxin [Corynebacterium poyangense]